MLPRNLHPNGLPRLGFALADVMQERPPGRATPACGLPRAEQLSKVDAVPGVVLIKRAYR